MVSPWNSLEVVKLLISIVSPIVLLLLGLWVRKFMLHKENEHTLTQTEIAWRIEVFKELTPILNQLYCYFMYVGNWNKISPHMLIKQKRECDRIVYTNSFLWSEDFMKAYKNFISGAFEEFQGKNQALRIKANRDRHQESQDWEDSWGCMFVEPEHRIRRAMFTKLYNAMLNLAVVDLEIFKKPAG